MTVMRSLAFATCLLMLPAALRGQRAAIAPAPSVLFQRVELPTPASAPPATHWKEGALIGGIPFGIFGFLLLHGLCQSNDSAGEKNCTGAGLGGAAFGFLIGAIPGALIGGQIPEHE